LFEKIKYDVSGPFTLNWLLNLAQQIHRRAWTLDFYEPADDRMMVDFSFALPLYEQHIIKN